MKPEVMELMRQGNQHFVLINELEVAAGKFIAKLCKSPGGLTGLVTGGAAAAIVVGYAGMMTEDLEPRIIACPDVTGFPRTEVIIQKSHRYPFDHQIRQTGAKLVEVETREEMIAAINPRTLAIHFTNILSDKGKVSGPRLSRLPRRTTSTPSMMPQPMCRRKNGFGSTPQSASTWSPSVAGRISADHKRPAF